MTDSVTVFDDCALIALQRNEPGADQAVMWMTKLATQVMMHDIHTMSEVVL